MTTQRLSIIFAALGLGLIGLSAQPTPQPGVQPPVSVVRALTFGQNGAPVIVAAPPACRATAQVAANANVCTITVGAADGTFEISGNVLITTATTHTFSLFVTYTDESNTSRSVTMATLTLAGNSLITTFTNANGTIPYFAIPLAIRAKAGTTIVVSTVGTFTTVTYNVEGVIKQIA